MTKTLLRALFFIMVFLLFACNQKNNSGLEIYLTDVESPWNKDYIKGDCKCCLEVEVQNLIEEPILSESDIESIDWNKQIIYLNDSGKERVSKLDFTQWNVLPGFRAALVLNKQPIYGFIIFPSDSSHGCDRVYTHLQSDKLILRFGSGKGSTRGEWKYGTDPRFDQKLKDHLVNNTSILMK